MREAHRWIAGMFVVLVIAAPLAIKRKRDASGVQVEVVAVEARALQPTVLASGTLAYRTEVNLTAEVLAKVSQILVREGEVVELGQLLLKLDPQTYNNAIDREGATLRQSRNAIERNRTALLLEEKRLHRNEILAKEQLIDQNSLDLARDQVEAARSELMDSENALRRSEAIVGEAYEQRAKTEIRSPLSGTVVSTTIKVGETAIPSTSVLAGAQLMKIADTSTVQAELKVDEADIGRVKVDQEVQITPAAFPDLSIHGKVQKIALDPTIEGLGRAYKVTTSLEPRFSAQLRSGMSARADILVGNGAKLIAVPVESVMSEADERGIIERYVWVLADMVASRRRVQTTISDDRWEAVASGLVAGEKVIVGPAKVLRELTDGARVSPVSDVMVAAK